MTRPSMVNLIPLSEPCLSGNEWQYVKACLDGGWLSSAGGYVDQFEAEMAQYLGAEHAVAVVNGTAALHIALLLSGVEPNDEVIAPTITFVAPIHAICYTRALPVFMDCDPYLNIDVEKTIDFCEQECFYDGAHLRNKTTKAKVKAIVVVHVFGQPVHIEPVLELAKKYHLKVIEDACESLGSTYMYMETGKTMLTGTLGDVGCFSFNGNKIMTAAGGGLLVVRDEVLARRARYLTTQAKDDADRFLHHNVGFNYRLSSLQAAMGCAQLEQLEDFIRIKRTNFLIYERLLQDVKGIALIREPSFGRSNYWLLTVQVEEEKYGRSASSLKSLLHDAGIESRFVWHPNHLQKPYREYQAYRIERATRIQPTCLNLPNGVSLREEQIEDICTVVRKYGGFSE